MLVAGVTGEGQILKNYFSALCCKSLTQVVVLLVHVDPYA